VILCENSRPAVWPLPSETKAAGPSRGKRIRAWPLKDKKDATETFTIVGVEELNFERDAVSWISPVGKALMAADMGGWIKLGDGRSAKIVKLGFKTGSD
jgi:hypothetical protein